MNTHNADIELPAASGSPESTEKLSETPWNLNACPAVSFDSDSGSDGFTPVPHQYHGDDLGHRDKLTGRWLKVVSDIEEKVYKTVGHHERILNYFGTRNGYLELDYQPKGDLWVYLAEHKDLPLSLRLKWAMQIAEGLAELHARSIVWADAHFRNVLVTDDLNVVLCDFAFSVFDPAPLHKWMTSPPPVFEAPDGYFGSPPTYVDIFAFGVMLFALFTYRFQWCPDLLPSYDIIQSIWDKYGSGDFETLAEVPELQHHFDEVLYKCLDARYASGADLLEALNRAREAWFADNPEMNAE
ncbi:kinase-like domain-containing protein [Roridomyces roridus]|uniref:Kinase-like domain-containing protein n=1 Tax=Roridomyces roridus TaxID=1738132 RepID=A0AAD7BFU9_9AGAR|nr:kinase-like domain-containing protein [Roridomyces roridus]